MRLTYRGQVLQFDTPPTPAELEAAYAARAASQRPGPEQRPLTDPEADLRFVEESRPGAPWPRVSVAVRLDGPLDEARLLSVMDAAIGRHPNLRATVDADAVRVLPIRSGYVEVARSCPVNDEALVQVAARISAEEAEHKEAIAAVLLRENDHQAALVVSVRHMFADAPALDSFIAEIGTAYADDAYVGNSCRDSGVPEAGNDSLEPAELPSAPLAYWRMALRDVRRRLTVSDVEHSGGETGWVPCELSAELSGRIRRAAVTAQVRPPAIFAAALQELLRCAGVGANPTIGMSVTVPVQTQVACAIRTLPVPVALWDEPPFEVIAQRIQQRIRDLQTYRHPRVADLVAMTSPGTECLYDAVLNYQVSPFSHRQWGTLSAEVVQLPEPGDGTLLTLEVLRGRHPADPFTVQMRGDASRLDEADVRCLLREYERILHGQPDSQHAMPADAPDPGWTATGAAFADLVTPSRLPSGQTALITYSGRKLTWGQVTGRVAASSAQLPDGTSPAVLCLDTGDALPWLLTCWGARRPVHVLDADTPVRYVSAVCTALQAGVLVLSAESLLAGEGWRAQLPEPVEVIIDTGGWPEALHIDPPPAPADGMTGGVAAFVPSSASSATLGLQPVTDACLVHMSNISVTSPRAQAWRLPSSLGSADGLFVLGQALRRGLPLVEHDAPCPELVVAKLVPQQGIAGGWSTEQVEESGLGASGPVSPPIAGMQELGCPIEPMTRTQPSLIMLCRSGRIVGDRCIGEIHLWGTGGLLPTGILARRVGNQIERAGPRHPDNMAMARGGILVRFDALARWLLTELDTIDDIEFLLPAMADGKLCVVVTSNRAEVDGRADEALQDQLIARLPYPAQPDEVHIVPSIDRSSADWRSALSQLLHRDEQSRFAQPEDEIEQAIAAVWKSVLGVQRVGALDDFFMLGGHSLSAVLVVSQLRDLGMAVNVGDVFQAGTVRKLAAAIKDAATPFEVETVTITDADWESEW
jgi:Phosphopantetheine attachment site